MIYYEDDRIKVRDICSEDVISLFMCWIDKEVNRYDPRPIPRTSKELAAECMNFCNRFERDVICENIAEIKYKYFIITDNEGCFIGFVNFFSMDRIKKQGEMGIIIGDKRCWNKGIACTAIKPAMEYIFDVMGFERIYIETGESNKPALRLFEKLNFRKCDEYVEDDGFKFVVMEKHKNSFYRK